MKDLIELQKVVQRVLARAEKNSDQFSEGYACALSFVDTWIDMEVSAQITKMEIMIKERRAE
jgi:hypothetical protein